MWQLHMHAYVRLSAEMKCLSCGTAVQSLLTLLNLWILQVALEVGGHVSCRVEQLLLTPVHFLTLRLVLTCLLQVAPEARGQVGDALAAYASVSEPADLAGLFRIALGKYSKVR
jgi:hypothetical protein